MYSSCRRCKEKLGKKGFKVQCQCSDCSSWFHKSCIQIDVFEDFRAGEGNWTCLYCMPDLGGADELRSSGNSAATLEDVMSKLDETILLKLIRMEEKYNSLTEEFVSQANESRTLKSELMLVKKELLEIKNRNEVNRENILKKVHEQSVKSNNVIIFDLLGCSGKD
ncbi:hypothetical protein HHI36_012883 [Cryptolaemus montrouzieri]|uniref:PHD-type domain-containing protein n=1 Tax=Cryptolaemus montrouzieri TaxID=559131 RepID=A0ABD2NG43_9CUCU